MNIFEEKLKGESVGTIMANNNVNRSNVYMFMILKLNLHF